MSGSVWFSLAGDRLVNYTTRPLCSGQGCTSKWRGKRENLYELGKVETNRAINHNLCDYKKNHFTHWSLHQVEGSLKLVLTSFVSRILLCSRLRCSDMPCSVSRHRDAWNKWNYLTSLFFSYKKRSQARIWGKMTRDRYFTQSASAAGRSAKASVVQWLMDSIEMKPAV